MRTVSAGELRLGRARVVLVTRGAVVDYRGLQRRLARMCVGVDRLRDGVCYGQTGQVDDVPGRVEGWHAAELAAARARVDGLDRVVRDAASQALDTSAISHKRYRHFIKLLHS